MAKDIIVDAKVNIEAEIGNFEKGLKKIKTDLEQLRLPNGMDDDFKKLYGNFEKELNNLKNKTQNNQIKLVDEQSVAESFRKLGGFYDSLIKQIKGAGGDVTFLEKDMGIINTLQNAVKKYLTSINESNDSLSKATQNYNDQLQALKKIQTLQNNVNSSQMNAQNKINAATEGINRLKSTKAKEEMMAALEESRKANEELNKAKEQHAKELASLKAQLATAKQNRSTVGQFNADIQNDYYDSLDKNGQHRGWNTRYERDPAAKFFSNAFEIQDAQVTDLENKIKVIEDLLANAADRAQDAKTKAGAAANRHAQLKEDEAEDIRRLNRELKEGTEAYDTFTRRKEEFQKSYQAGTDTLKEYANTIEEIKSKEFATVLKDLEKIDWSQIEGGKPDIKTYEDLTKYLDQLEGKSHEAAVAVLDGLNPALESIENSGQAAKRGTEAAVDGAKKIASVQSDLERLTNRLAMFFSIDNAVRLFRRAIRTATNAIKELDKVMTETAVVTEFTISDMWKQLPEYTKRANELGLAVRDVYQASTLYYQQGLQTNEVMQVTNATLRMARIASLDASEATDRMTNALRGFNMEINETNADNVADVYSKLAAISASNVDEISTAMTKVASLANNANMSFENTAAFLSQIIETTRESAETAGTALKTVIARFSEVKDLYSKDQLLGTDDEGEEIDVNKVSEALRTAGINLNEFLVGQKGLDEIFMELASKWDDLDMVQQRYIATMAAGSRQQSRFIALMSDYRRTQELTSAAQEASGASMEQYEKTLESIETKVNRLKNAWNEFLMGIANDQAVRGVIDALTKFLQTLNKITDSISGGKGFLKSIANIGITLGGLKLGGMLTKTIFGDPRIKKEGLLTKFLLGAKETQSITKSGFNAGVYYRTGVIKGIRSEGGMAEALKYAFRPTMSANELGLKTVNLSDIDFKYAGNSRKFNKISLKNLSQMAYGAKEGLSVEQQNIFRDLNIQLRNGKLNASEYAQKMKEAGIQMNMTGEQADQLGIKFKNTTGLINTTSVAMMGLGAAMIGITALIEKLTGKQTPLTKAFKATGTALLALGAILPIVSTAFQKFGMDVSMTIWNIPIIGWIAAIISALIGLITYLSEVIETPAEAAQHAKEALEQATEAANQAQQAVDDLASSYKDLADSADKLKDLVKGTKEWQKAVEENNKKVLDLLETYKELEIESKDGILTITNYDQVIEDYNNRAKNLQLGVMGANINSIYKDLDNDVNKAVIEYLSNLALESGGNEIGDVYGEEFLRKLIKPALWAEQFAEPWQWDEEVEGIKELANLAAKGKRNEIEQITGKPISDADFQMLRELGTVINSAAAQIDALYDASAALAVQYANLTESQKKYSDSLVNGAYNIDKTVERLTAEIPLNYYDLDLLDKGEYLRYVQETYGKNVRVGEDGSFKINDNTFEWLDEQPKFMQWLAATRDYAQALENQTKYLDDLTKVEDDVVQAFAKVYEGTYGSELTANDLANLSKLVFEDQGKLAATGFHGITYDRLVGGGFEGLTQSDLIKKGLLQQYWNRNEELKKAFDGDFEAWAANFSESVLKARARIDKAVGFFGTNFERTFGNFSSTLIESVTNQLETYAPTQKQAGALGSKFAEALVNITTDESEQKVILQAFSAADLTSQQSLKQMSSDLKKQGIDIATEQWQDFINLIVDTTNALNQIDLSAFKENFKDIEKIIDNLREGTQDKIFSIEDYEKIKEFVNPADFRETSYGAIYVGDNFDQLGDEIQTAIGQGFEEVGKILDTKIKLDEVYEKAKEDAKEGSKSFEAEARRRSARGAINNSSNRILTQQDSQLLSAAQGWATAKKDSDEYWDQIYYYLKDNNDLGLDEKVSEDVKQRTALLNFIDSLNKTGELQNVGIPELINLNEEAINNMDPEKLQSLIDQIELEIGKKLTYWNEQYDNELQARLQNGFDALMDQWGGDKEDSELDLLAYEQFIKKLNISDEIKKEILQGFEDASKEDLVARFNVAEQFETIGKDIKENELGYSVEEVKDYADELVRVEKFTKENYDLAVRYANQQIKVNTATKKLIDSYKDWSKLFDENGPLGKEQNFELSSEQFKIFDELKRALQESLGLEEDLSDEFFKSAKNAELLKTMMTGTVEEQKTAYQEIGKNAAIDILLNMDPANEEIKSFQDSLRTLDLDTLTVDALIDLPGFQESLKAMVLSGDEAGKATAEAIIKALHLEQKLIPKNQTMDIFDPITGTHMLVDTVTYEMEWVPVGSYSPPDFSTLGNADTGKSSGSSSKQKLWKNPYDELYNKQQEINTALRERERLEHKYQDMLEDHTKTSADLVKNNLEQIASLKRQIQLQEQLLKGRQRQLSNVANEMYEDSEGNRTTYAAMGVTRYVTFDEATREIHIDWGEINKITDERLGSAIEAYVSRLDELLKAESEIEDTIEELNDSVIEINKRGREEYLDFEQQVYEAIVAETEAEIEALENVSQTIKDAADKTIQSVQDEINKERQLRENEKEEQSILDKQMRLAYLKRDTSGANALEIKKLEEELANDTQSYQDKIIDQTIQEMQDEAEKAAEQREQQINLLRQSLEIDKATGEIWNKVNEYIAGSIDKDGSLIKGSKLEKLLKDSADYTGMSRFGKENWDDDMAEKIAQAMMGVQSWELKEGKESGKLTLGDDNHTVLRYNPQKGTWYNTRTGESYTDDDLGYDYSQGKMVLKKKTSTQNQQQQQSGDTAKQNQDSKTQEPQYKNYTVQKDDSPWSIAEKQLGNGSRYTEIMQLNGLQPGQYIYAGQILKLPKYAQGGLVDTTGPAWLDGSKSRPEMVLDAADTRNLITLKNVLASILNNAKNSNANQMGGDNYFNIDIQAEIDSDYDVDQLVDRIKKQIYDDASYRNVNVISTMR